MAVALPLIGLIASGAGAAAQGVAQSNAMATNSAVYAQEGKIAAAQGYQAEATNRRQSTEAMGRSIAAAGQAGGGYDGSTGASLRQSAVNAELDALSIRYKSSLQKWGFTTQSQNLKDESTAAGNAGFLKAGASLLKGVSNNYVSPGLTDLG